MKLLFFCGVPIDDSAEIYRIGLLAKQMKKLEHEITFTSVSANFKKLEEKTVQGLLVRFIGQAHYRAKKPFSKRESIAIPKLLVNIIKTCFSFKAELHKKKPDLIFLVTASPISLTVGLVSKILGYKVLIDIDDLVPGQMAATGYNNLAVDIYNLIEKVIVKIFDRVSVCSQYLKKRYPGSVIIPNSIFLDVWQNEAEVAKLKQIAFVGQIGAYHGQMEFIIKTVPFLKKERDKKIIFIGGGEELVKLKSKVTELGIKNQVIFTGYISQKEVSKILNQSMVGVIPLWNQPVHLARHPLKLLEYLAGGLVVVTNNVGETANIIQNNINGYLCPAGNLDCLVQKSFWALNNYTKAGLITENAEKTAKEYSYQEILPLWLNYLNHSDFRPR